MDLVESEEVVVSGHKDWKGVVVIGMMIAVEVVQCWVLPLVHSMSVCLGREHICLGLMGHVRAAL